MLRSLLSFVICGGGCAEDITRHLRSELEQLKGFKVCSADTLLRMQKELATEKEICVSKANITHEFNINSKLNKLLVRLLLQTSQLKPTEKKYVFDYDNQFIPTKKYDSKRSCKHANGYFPCIAFYDLLSDFETIGMLSNFHSFHKRVQFLYVLLANPNVATSIFRKFTR